MTARCAVCDFSRCRIPPTSPSQSSPDVRINWQGLHPVLSDMHESAVVFDAAVADQVREQSQGVIGERLIDEGLLALQ